MAFLGARKAGRACASEFNPPDAVVPPEFFGMHIHDIDPAVAKYDHNPTTQWPVVAFSSWRLWDAFAQWSRLEPKRGVWDLTIVDEYTAVARKHHARLLLPLGITPQWASSRPQEACPYNPGGAAEPADIEDWKTFVRTVAKRYRGVIREYEIWNEPNVKEFFTGDEAKMLALARAAYGIIKSVDPKATVVSPAPTTSGGLAWLDRYLALGGANYADVIGFHLYVTPEPPEAMYTLALRVREILRKHGVHKPLWNTESGWFGKRKDFQPFDAGAADYVVRAYLLNWAAGAERFYWYAWDDGAMSVRLMGEDQLRPTSPALAYARARSWLVGARMLSCAADSEGVWTCILKRPLRRKAWVLWASGQTARRPRLREWAGRRIYALDGSEKGFPIPDTLEIGPSPVLIQ